MPVGTKGIAKHATSHQEGGDDEVTPADHASRHESGGADVISGIAPDFGEDTRSGDINVTDSETFVYEVTVTVTAGLTLHVIMVEMDYTDNGTGTTIFRLRRGGTSGGTDGTLLRTWTREALPWDGPTTFIVVSTGAPTGSVLYKLTAQSDDSGGIDVRDGSRVAVLAFSG